MTKWGWLFHKCLSQAIERDGTFVFAEFARKRNHSDFKIDIELIDDPVDIGTAALAGLCDPDEPGKMDWAVLDALVQFFFEYCLAHNERPSMASFVSALQRTFPTKKDSEYRECLSRWLHAETRMRRPQEN